ncbi:MULTISPECIES: hypothetical protein [Pseudomonas syringae group]|uniref:hypothetical protein n=1 Tax=Pseudomonas syringae group TaxID=136849 RepID=UPI000EFF8EA0|nr:hypothetical protein [Pseudomonas coronafaciens]
MKTIVSYLFEGPAHWTGLSPGEIARREYDSKADAFIPNEGDSLIIQWGPTANQSNTFVVKGVKTSIWKDSDDHMVIVAAGD